MSDDEEPELVYYGTPLEPYGEDAFPKRKPISVEDQIATDSHGRRRFHGAFTGGFSAGFFNTVGSLEGWTPNEFKSTRSEKANSFIQKPEDFMDDEDTGEFGFAPQTIKATKDYSTVKKRARKAMADGPIPGVPVLETLITSGNETVGYLLLRNMGIEEKIKKKHEELNPIGRVYGCEMPTKYQISEDISNKEYKIPDIYKEYLKKPKSNTAGFGYQGLEKPHINLFHSTNLVVRDKQDKRISIGGQAFGVGAFEEDDDDIYMKEDMSNYDFELTKEKDRAASKKDSTDKILVHGMFLKDSSALIPKKQFSPPIIPNWFTGVHKVKKSRFEPIENVKVDVVPRNQMNAVVRARYLGEEPINSHTPSIDSFQGSDANKMKAIKEEKETDNFNNFDASSLLTDKFVSASKKEDVNDILETVEKPESLHGTQEMRDAAKMKMFGPLTRLTSDWQPCSVLCRRFNVPEPFSDKPTDKNKKRTKNLIFQVQKHEDVNIDLKPGISRTSGETSSSLSNNLEVVKTEPSENESISLVGNELPVDLTKDVNVDNSKLTDIEKNLPIDVSEKIGIEDKLDLYKAVFLSSSESEDENEPEKENSDKTSEENKIEEFKVSILSEPLIPQIKPIKEGILSGIDFKDFNKNRNNVQLEINTDDLHNDLGTPKNPLLYGPQIPIRSSQKDETVCNVNKQIIVSSGSEEEWIEKNSVDKKKKSKYKKKDKKHKHKKHKKKDKR